jgi:exodeoxyribonuclease-1
VTIVFYDTETTGIEPAFDQILQFAAIRTDEALNEIDRFEIRCRLQPHIVPAIGALEVNRITAQDLGDPKFPTHYEMVRAIREKLTGWSPSLFAGYNSLKFDEHFLRQALYQTLHLPYLTNTNSNTRTDVLPILQASAVLVPGAVSVPLSEEGKAVFRLDRIAPANNFHHRNPHDALSDVEATVHLCRMVAANAPEIWSTFIRFSQKAAVTNYILEEPIFCVFEYFGGAQARLVTTIGKNAENNSEYYVYDLGIDPGEPAALAEDELIALLKSTARPVRRLRSNAAPLLMAADAAPEFASGKALAFDELERRVQLVRPGSELCARLVAAHEAARKEKTVSPHVERQIYDSFLTTEDEALLERFHALPWDQRWQVVEQFSDSRMKRLGRRLIYLERPDVMDEARRRAHDRAWARRVLGHGDDVPWRTMPQALREIDEALTEAAEDRTGFLVRHREHLVACQMRADRLLEQQLVSVAGT